MTTPAADSPGSGTAAPGLAELRERAAREVAGLDAELAEIELLVAQAKSEASRHETRRAQAAEKLASAAGSGSGSGGGSGAGTSATGGAHVQELRDQLVTLTKRATLMEAQVDVLTGKQKALTRFRDALSELSNDLATVLEGGLAVVASPVSADGDAAPLESVPPSVSRIVLGAQEDMRREIARAMHDGPAQSLTNIVLQAQIVERLLAKDPDAARGEAKLLVAMVQQTLDATKSFIFDVRPMVLDDLGLVPTIRRAARERGRRAQVPVDFDTVGADRRLPMETESALFRILDEALNGYLSVRPDRVSIRLDWSDQFEARVAAIRELPAGAPETAEAEPLPDTADLPPALATMVEARRADQEAAKEAARIAAIAALPSAAWREIQHRAATIGISAELLGGGGELRLVADVSPAG